MNAAHVCEKCRIPGDLPNETLLVYDEGNQLVGKLHRFVVVDMEGRFYAKAIASDATWLAFEAERMKLPVPALYPAAYTHAGRKHLTSDPLPSLADALLRLEAQFAEVRAWLEQRTGPIEIVT